MAHEIVMPRLGWGGEDGSLVEWLKKDGEMVAVSEIVCTVEGDKAINEVESLDEGILRIPPDAPQPGVKVPVGTILAYLVEDGEAAPFEAGNGEGPGVRPVASRANEPVVHLKDPPISPRARRIAAELGVRWTELQGSGRSGRIVERDVQAAAARVSAAAASPLPLGERGGEGPVAPHHNGDSHPAGAQTLTLPLSQGEREPDEVLSVEERGQPFAGVRKLIATRMATSAHTVAAVTLTTEVDATALVGLRSQLKADRAGTTEIVPSYNDLLAKIVAVALVDHPALNASLVDEVIVTHDAVHVGIAVDTDRGLLVPVVRDVATKSVHQIALESARLIEAARAGTIASDDLGGGTFTITNLGPYEIDSFTPIVNLPECAILGVGRIVARPVVVDEATEEVAVRKLLTLSLTFDHRLVDGAPAARFLQRVKRLVEHPTLWLIR